MAAYQPKHKAQKCKIKTEWKAGDHIGRRYCSVHDVHWDDGGPCPKQETLGR